MFRASKQQKTRTASIFFKVYTIAGAECAEYDVRNVRNEKNIFFVKIFFQRPYNV